MTDTPKILIVDDEHQNLRILAQIMKEQYITIAARNGAEALTRAQADPPPDLILLDIIMPKMDGYEVCRRLKANPQTSQIPVIFITAMNDVEDETRGLELGAIDYITKPISPPIVRARVNNHLALQQARHQIEKQKHALEQQNIELTEAARLREDVEYITRHDLKTPLGPIINFPAIILEEGGALSERQMRYLNHIESAGYRMLDIINRSLDLFKMERRKYQFTPDAVDLLSIFRKIETDTQNLIQSKNLTIRLRVHGQAVQADETFYVKGEELLCYSMLANLVKNALEASPAGEMVTIAIDQESGMARIRIQNRGSVPEGIRERFFDKYITAGKIQGTGLGTYSAKLIAETQRGRIAMTSSEPEGTILTVHIPVLSSP